MAGKGSRLQPIGFSKELYPCVNNGKHCAVSEFSIQSMLEAQVDEIKLIVSPEKLDIPKYYANYKHLIGIYFYASPSLPESCLYAINSLHDEDICLFGLPDTIFAPSNAFSLIKQELLNGSDICLGLFLVPDGSKFDSVKLDSFNNVKGVLVKKSPPLSNWIWGIWGANVKTLRILFKEISKQHTNNEKLLGVGFDKLTRYKNINFKGVKLGDGYFDIGTMESVVNVNETIRKFSPKP